MSGIFIEDKCLKLFEHSRTFMHGYIIRHKLVLVHFDLIMVKNTPLMNLDIIFPNIELHIKLRLL